ncbi:MAG: quinoprotein dehydrogenase-associated SoxYZ-like carrier [Hyphomicrobiales bacterium]|nr:quinoprotein dehydrogenase-associated SoxYZ-like carrier [Hyphomicrobiales bacterium]
MPGPLSRRSLLGAALSAPLLPAAARAGSAWDDIRTTVYGSRPVLSGGPIRAFSAPYRAEDQRAVPLSLQAAFGDGRTIKSIAFIVDENPMPVAATFRFADGRDKADLSLWIRLDQQSNARVVVEASDGALYAAEKFVKASGLGVCAAPPITDDKEIAATMGRMRFVDLTKDSAGATEVRRHAQMEVLHPQNTGMQMNQVTLLYIPMRYVSRISAQLGATRLFDMEGSMTLCENPRLAFDYRLNGADKIALEVEDTSKAVWKREFPAVAAS